MKLCRLRFEQYYINQYGRKEMSGSTYRVLETVDVWENGEFWWFHNGYEPAYKCPVFESNDGRTWAQVQNHIDYWGGVSYFKLFKEPKDPSLSKNKIGPSHKWETYVKVRKMQLVNDELLPVDIDGNLL